MTDSLGHDRRYAAHCSKAEAELRWRPTIGFEHGLADAVEWYRANAPWVERVRSEAYPSVKRPGGVDGRVRGNDRCNIENVPDSVSIAPDRPHAGGGPDRADR